MSYYQRTKQAYKPFTITVRTDEANGTGIGNNPSPSNAFRLPLDSLSEYRMVVNWGDGNEDTRNYLFTLINLKCNK